MKLTRPRNWRRSATTSGAAEVRHPVEPWFAPFALVNASALGLVPILLPLVARALVYAGPLGKIEFMTADERIAKLEAQIDDLQTRLADLNKQLTKAQIDQWQGRIEDLEVQLHLGAMESSDRLNGLMAGLRARWADGRKQLEDKASTATSVADTVRTGLENAFAELRKALLETKSKLS